MITKQTIEFFGLRKISNMNFEDFVTNKFEGAGFVFFTSDKKILMLQKPNKKWSLVGGHREKGETPLQTAKRECKEEIGFLPKGEIIDFIKYKRKETNTWGFTFLMKIKEPFRVSLSNEHVDYKWIPLNGLGNYTISKAVNDMFPLLKNALN